MQPAMRVDLPQSQKNGSWKETGISSITWKTSFVVMCIKICASLRKCSAYVPQPWYHQAQLEKFFPVDSIVNTHPVREPVDEVTLEVLDPCT